MKYFLISFLILCSSTFASDFTVTEANGKKVTKLDRNYPWYQALAYPTYLLQQGIFKIGGLDVKNLLEEIRTVKVVRQGLVFFAGAGHDGDRHCSMYNVEKRTVYYNQICHSQLEDSASNFLAFHEFLGALGYLDKNYELTVPIVYLVTMMTLNKGFDARSMLDSALFDHFHDIKRTNVSPRLEYAGKEGNGGISGVGGGGDGHALLTKFLVLNQHNEISPISAKNETKKQKERIKLILNTPIEVRRMKGLNFFSPTLDHVNKSCVFVKEDKNKKKYIVISEMCLSSLRSDLKNQLNVQLLKLVYINIYSEILDIGKGKKDDN